MLWQRCSLLRRVPFQDSPIDRGYEKVEGKLQALGADIQRVSIKPPAEPLESHQEAVVT